MAFLGQTFNADELPQGNGNYDTLPPGWYTANITAAELKPTKDGTGQYIKIRYDITGPTHQGRVVFGNINIKNANPKAEEIGRMALGNLMRAIGLAKVTDTDQLIGGSLLIKLSVRDATEQYDAQNEVKGFKAITGSVPSFAAPAASPAASAPAAAAPVKATPPWAKGK